jgi:hypothetical protein
VGSTLGRFGLAGALTRAQLTLFDARGLVLATNTNWTAATNSLEIARIASQVGAFPLTTGSADCALLIDLAPGNYTAQVTGSGGEAGVALIEVYEVP